MWTNALWIIECGQMLPGVGVDKCPRSGSGQMPPEWEWTMPPEWEWTNALWNRVVDKCTLNLLIREL